MPDPGTLVLLGSGVLGLAGTMRRRLLWITTPNQHLLALAAPAFSVGMPSLINRSRVKAHSNLMEAKG